MDAGLASTLAAEAVCQGKGALLENLSLLWSGLERRQQALFVGGAVALVVILLILTRLAANPTQSLLYAGLDPAAAGEVIAALEARGVTHSVRGDAIYVEAAARDTLRLGLAAEGLPANGAAGYELLDQLSAFGTTSQMFDAAFLRAREGELARTILASPHIRAARVHIAMPMAQPFGTRQDVTASVAVRPAAGGLTPEQAEALRHLVASSVPALNARNVTVIDADSGQVIGSTQSLTTAASDQAERLRQNILRLLEARVGSGNAVVEVAVDLSSATETLTERRIDPESRIAISTETEESTNSSRDTGGAGVSVASNLPAGAGATGTGEASAQANESRVRTTFDLSEVQREVQMHPGALERVTVAVLVNQSPDSPPRGEEEIAALSDLVRSAIGFDEARGDTVTIRAMTFEPRPEIELVESGGLLARIDPNRLVQMAILAAVALGLGFGLLRPLLQKAQNPDASSALTGGATSPALAQITGGGGRGMIALQRDGADAAGPQVIALGAAGGPAAPQVITAQMGDYAAGDLPALGDVPMPALAALDPVSGENGEDPIERLRRLIEEREDDTVEILRSWMAEDEEARS